MNHAALIVAWWLLATRKPMQMPDGVPYPTSEGQMMEEYNRSLRPEALGPYPTEAMCIEAERKVMPSNKKFWNDQDRLAEHNRTLFSAQEMLYKSRLCQLTKENPKPGRYRLPDGTIFTVQIVFQWGGSAPECDATYNDKQNGTQALFAFIEGTPGKTIPPKPNYDLYTSLPADSYTVDQECQPVKGWYQAVK
jgi:hypothetical protein